MRPLRVITKSPSGVLGNYCIPSGALRDHFGGSFFFVFKFALNLLECAQTASTNFQCRRTKTLGDEIEEVPPAGVAVTVADVITSRRSASANVANFAHKCCKIGPGDFKDLFHY